MPEPLSKTLLETTLENNVLFLASVLIYYIREVKEKFLIRQLFLKNILNFFLWSFNLP